MAEPGKMLGGGADKSHLRGVRWPLRLLGMAESKSSLLAERLRILRAQKHLSQAEVAEQIDVSQTTYGSYERGATEPSASQVGMLACLYGVTSDYILGIVEFPHSLPTDGWIEDPETHKAMAIPRNARVYTSREYQKVMEAILRKKAR